MRNLQVPLHVTCHRLQERQGRVHMELRSRPMHLLWPVRGRLQGAGAQPERRYAPGVHRVWGIEEVVHAPATEGASAGITPEVVTSGEPYIEDHGIYWFSY